MAMDIDTLIKTESAATPDPERSLKNLERLAKCAPDVLERYADRVGGIASLFAYSQFLADYCAVNPDSLVFALETIGVPVTKAEVLSGAPAVYAADKKAIMKLLRDVRRRYLVRITLRDTSGATDLMGTLAELSALADALVAMALDAASSLMRERFGEMADNAFSVISLGKLGAEELNYSSDIDIITVYEHADGASSGVVSASGVRTKKITAHEYYRRLTETISTLLAQQTEDGIVYRVDLRLRPDGRKGELSLPLSSYAAYYEAWGKTWERMMLIRARPVAGDVALGRKFLDAIAPFVWKKTADYYDIEEIRELKRKIDTVFDANDIKRGYGGIREIEFFVQTFQLLYGGERRSLRSGKLAIVLEELLREEFLTAEDVRVLLDSYLFLRRVEHVLQMKNDTQTHTLPGRPGEIEIFARKLGFADERAFSSQLRLLRLKVRDMYNSLLGGPESRPESAIFLEDVLTDDEIRDYLAYKAFRDPESALKDIKSLQEQVTLGKTIRERTLLRKTIPMFLEQILKSESKDRALSMFVTLIAKIGSHESYIDLFSQRPDIIELIVRTFAESTYLTRSLLSLDNLENLFEYPDVRMDYASVKERLLRMLEYSREPRNAVREFKTIEEMRTGVLFLERVFDVEGFSNKLSMLADTIVRSSLNYLGIGADLAVVALGRFGARELVISSDLDLIFVSRGRGASRKAEEFIKFLSAYTEKGVAYPVDMRLRPDGSKGILVNDIDGYRNYYLKTARPWELQALLRARVIAGEKGSLKAFTDLKREVIVRRGGEITGGEIREMRARIVHELSKEREGYDIKLGPGGIEEALFIIQYLQLKHAAAHPNVVTPKTSTAIAQLIKHGVLDEATARELTQSYAFLRTVEAMLRLNGENVLKPGSELAAHIGAFLGLKTGDALIARLEGTRRSILEIARGIY